MPQNARGAIALNSQQLQFAEDQASQLQGQVVVFEETGVMQTIDRPGTNALRRSVRIAKEVPILLIGSDARGREFVEQTKTVVLSRHGAGIVSMHKLSVEQELIVTEKQCQREAEIRVVGEIGSEDGLYTYGVTFLDPDIDFWGLEFGSATEAGTSDPRMALHCNICGRREVIDLDGLESDVYAIHDCLLRDCKQCQRSTLWKRTPAEARDNAGSPEAVTLSSEPAPALKHPALPAASKNRRQHMRIKVNFTGCVRNHGSEEDIVVCENISRGGLCFKSSRCYDKTAAIEVAAPYTPGSPDIPVSARIVHVQELPEEKMFRYGAQYLLPVKDSRSATILSA